MSVLKNFKMQKSSIIPFAAGNISFRRANNKGEVIKMTSKEILYVEDALGHAQFLMQQSQNAVNTLQDAALKQQAQQLVNKNQQIFQQFYSLV
jgi:hypothetical protein